MRIGILSDTHDEITRTQSAVDLLLGESAEALIHCGDLMSTEIISICSVVPFYFCFGNHDCDNVPYLLESAKKVGAYCLKWGGEIELNEKRIAIVHGHLTMDLKPLLQKEPHYLLSGHSHMSSDRIEGSTRRINPGALHRADKHTVAILDLKLDELRFLEIP